MRIAFLTSIYPKHVEDIYNRNPKLSEKSSDEQMEFIRWHALSSYVRWVELLEHHNCKIIQFHNNLDSVEYSWAKENNFYPLTKNKISEIGLEKIKRFKPNIIYCTAPFTYTQNHFIQSLLKILEKRPKLIAWYGANCGDEKIFNLFDLTLSNSEYLVNRIRKKGNNAALLRHSFDPIILEKIKSPPEKKNRVSFFGNLDNTSLDFQDRTKCLQKISNKTQKLDIYGDIYCPNFSERIKFDLLKKRSYLAASFAKIFNYSKLIYWSNTNNLPPSPWSLPVEFAKSVKPALFGYDMLSKLSSYKIAFNYHNKHTGDHACNMRIFEASGVGSCVLTDHKSDIQSLFEPDREIITYKSIDEAISKIQYLVDNPKVTEEIGLAGQRKTLAKHTTEKQIEHLYFFLSKVLN